MLVGERISPWSCSPHAWQCQPTATGFQPFSRERAACLCLLLFPACVRGSAEFPVRLAIPRDVHTGCWAHWQQGMVEAQTIPPTNPGRLQLRWEGSQAEGHCWDSVFSAAGDYCYKSPVKERLVNWAAFLGDRPAGTSQKAWSMEGAPGGCEARGTSRIPGMGQGARDVIVEPALVSFQPCLFLSFPVIAFCTGPVLGETLKSL